MKKSLITFSFLSGSAALIFEIIWMKYFSYIFGQSSLSVASVVTSFMFGLSIGSIIFGKIVDKTKNALRILLFLELGIGIFGLLFPPLFWITTKIYLAIHSALALPQYVLNLLRFFLSFVVLIIPTSLMGGTIPVLAKLFIKDKSEIDKGVGLIYFANNLGASLGTLLCGFLLLYFFGLIASLIFASVINLSICLFIIIFLRKQLRDKDLEIRGVHTENIRAESSYPKNVASLALAVFIISGFISLALEVLWTRILTSSVLSSSVYSFSVVLISFIFGLSLGSFIYTKLLARLERPLLLFGLVQILIGITSILLLDALKMISNLFFSFWYQTSQSWISLVIIGGCLTFAFMLAPTTLMGMNLPLISRIYIGRLRDIGNALGKVLFFQTLACTFGSFSAGFILTYILGIQKSIIFLGLLSFSLGILILNKSLIPQKIKLISNALLALVIISVLVITPTDLQYNRDIPGKTSRVLFYNEGPSVTVAAREVFDPAVGKFFKRLEIDGAFVAGTNPTMLTDQKILAHLPLLLFGKKVKNTLTVGFGSGATSYTMSLYDVEHINCVELNHAVIKAAKYFEEINFNILDNPRYKVFIDDAKSFMQSTNLDFDIISTDCTDLAFYGNAGLYSLEYFETCHGILSNDGIMCAWVPISNITSDDLKMIIKTFQRVFRYSSIWFPDNYLSHYIVLIGSENKLIFNQNRIERILRNENIKNDLAEVHIDNAYKVMSFLLLDEEATNNFCKNSRINSDNYPYLEFSAAKVTHTTRYQHETWAENLSCLLEYAHQFDSMRDRFKGAWDTKQLSLYFEAREHIIKAYIHTLHSDLNSSLSELQKAAQINPNDTALQNSLLTMESNMYRSVASQYYRQNQLQEAEKYFRRSIELNPENAIVYNELGVLLCTMGKFDDAEVILKRGLETDSEIPSIYKNLANVYLRRNINLQKALELAKEAARMNPEAEYLLFLSIAYERNHLFSEANDTLKKAFKLYPGNKALTDYLKVTKKEI
jgi:spermidine synthase